MMDYVADWTTGEKVLREAMPEDNVVTPPSLEDYEAAIQAHIDATARSRGGYRHGDALAGHVTDPNHAWAAEAQAFVAWRSSVWQHAYALWAEIPPPQPTVADVIASLPEIIWPEG